MNRLVAAAVLVGLAACSWSNSLYQARLLSHTAERAETQPGAGGAQGIWGQVQVKAESAYARGPNGKRGAEALWLQGHAAAHSNDCGRAVPLMRHVMLIGPEPAWRDELVAELAACEARTDPAGAVVDYALLFRTSRDTTIRRGARLAYAHALVQVGLWDPAVRQLDGLDVPLARLDRALALVHLHLADSAFRQLRPALASGDTTIAWPVYIDAFAVESVSTTDSLLAHLLAIPHLAPNTGTAWVAEAGISAQVIHPMAADRWLQIAGARPAGRAAQDARTLRQVIVLQHVATLPAMVAVLDSLGNVPPVPSVVGSRLASLIASARVVIDRNKSIAPSAVHGDIAIFELGGFARDTLGVPGIAAWLFGRVEREWPASPYVGKAMLARIQVEPDSAAAVRTRALALRGSAYMALAEGDPAARLRVTRLEDSLAQYLRLHPPFAAVVNTTTVVQEQDERW